MFGQNSHENPIEKKKVSSFETAKGSVYTYQPDGSIHRFKKATNEEFKTDVVVFIPDWKWFEKNAPKEFLEKMESEGEFDQQMLQYIQSDGEQLKVWIIDENGKKIDNAKSLAEAKKAILYFGTQDKPDFMLPVFKEAKIGFSTFDTIKYQDENGEWKRRRHIGNKVTKINYE